MPTIKYNHSEFELNEGSNQDACDIYSVCQRIVDIKTQIEAVSGTDSDDERTLKSIQFEGYIRENLTCQDTSTGWDAMVLKGPWVHRIALLAATTSLSAASTSATEATGTDFRTFMKGVLGSNYFMEVIPVILDNEKMKSDQVGFVLQKEIIQQATDSTSDRTNKLLRYGTIAGKLRIDVKAIQKKIDDFYKRLDDSDEATSTVYWGIHLISQRSDLLASATYSGSYITCGMEVRVKIGVEKNPVYGDFD